VSEIRLSRAARQDFLDIGVYMRDRWSEAQAERYLKQMLGTMLKSALIRFLVPMWVQFDKAIVAAGPDHI
jgi:hypothetical protein